MSQVCYGWAFSNQSHRYPRGVQKRAVENENLSGRIESGKVGAKNNVADSISAFRSPDHDIGGPGRGLSGKAG